MADLGTVGRAVGPWRATKYARTVAPQLISYTEIPYTTATNPMVTGAAVSWLAGDTIVVIAGAENVGTINAPTATGLVFAPLKDNAAAGASATRGAAATATADGSSTISITGPGGGFQQGAGIWVCRGSDGVGSSVEQHTTTQTVSLQLRDTHSLVLWSVFDFNASTLGLLTPTPSNTREAARQVGHYTVYSADIIDQAAITPVSVGVTGAPATGPFSIIGVEVLGSYALPPVLVMPPRVASPA